MNRALVQNLLIELGRANAVLRDTNEDQWEKGTAPISKVGATSPAREHPPRPTEDVVLNEPRLALREAVHELEMSLAVAEERISAARARVERAHGRWKGLTPADEV